MTDKKKIAVLGGTGNLGYALAWRWARAGHQVTIGSRMAERAQDAAARLNQRLGKALVAGADNAAATRDAQVVTLAVPFAAQKATLDAVLPALSGQLLIDATVPLAPPQVAVAQLPREGSAAAITRNTVGERARVAAAFHNVAAELLEQDVPVDCDILVTADDAAVRREAMELVEDSGCRAVDAGRLANAAATEALTSLLIHINRAYKARHAGIRVTGIGPAGDDGPAE